MGKRKGRKKAKKDPVKKVNVNKQVLQRLHLNQRITLLENAVKQMQSTIQGLFEHLEQSRRLNAHYLVSINTLASVAVDSGMISDSQLNEIRVEVIAEADYDKKKYQWAPKSVHYDSLTDKWYYVELDGYQERGPFLDEKAAVEEASKYIAKSDREHQIAHAKPRPKLVHDRLAELERLAKLEILGDAVSEDTEPAEELAPSPAADAATDQREVNDPLSVEKLVPDEATDPMLASLGDCQSPSAASLKEEATDG